jgi:hypothetical protein
MFGKIKKLILDTVFKISPQPVLFSELMIANKQFNEGMHLKGINLGYRLKLGKTYLVFLLLAHVFILPGSYILHEVFATADCHLSIITAVLFTMFLFAFFGMFKEWLFDEIASIRIQHAWKIHFPHFPYEEYKNTVSKIYNEALDEDIQKVDLERYILDKLIEIN